MSQKISLFKKSVLSSFFSEDPISLFSFLFAFVKSNTLRSALSSARNKDITVKEKMICSHHQRFALLVATTTTTTTTTTHTSSSRIRGRRPTRTPSKGVKASSTKKDSIDWDEQNDRFKAERIFDQCLGAIADGDEEMLESCLLQIESDKKVQKLSKKLEQAAPDVFWKKKVKEIAAARIVDDCMAAILSGDASEIDGCMVELENEDSMEYLEGSSNNTK